MASIFGHALTSIAIGNTFSKTVQNWKFWILGILCSIIPDADVISFKLGIPYEAFWGHRGFTHSFMFALILGSLITILFYRKHLMSHKGIIYVLFFTVCTASHSILDALTDGGLGVAFFSPFDNTRYFFPWRPIKVSPIGIANFFSEWGKTVLLSELIWIGIPNLLYILLVKGISINSFLSKNKENE
ncbi:MAG: metal-dependent hydrolase [Flavobacteriaceae bacterium]|nr:metal-dependent hydrolase [Flavobacteriaceae bacterium]